MLHSILIPKATIRFRASETTGGENRTKIRKLPSPRYCPVGSCRNNALALIMFLCHIALQLVYY